MASPEVEVLRGAALPTAVVAGPLLIGSGVLGGVGGLAGALAGTVLVTGFFGVGFLVDRRTRRLAPSAVMGVAMMTYLVKVTLLAVVLVALKGTTAFNTTAFAVVVITLTVVWLGGEVRAFTRARFRYVEPAATGSATASITGSATGSATGAPGEPPEAEASC